MNQEEIREYQGQRYSAEEGAKIIKELDKRTESDIEGFESLREVGDKVRNLSGAVDGKLDAGMYEGSAQDLSDAISGISSGYQGKLLIADTPATDGIYDPIENGTYPNAGNLVYDPAGMDKGFKVQFIKNNNTWTKNRIDLNIEEKVIPLNKLKDVKTYGLPSDWVATSLAQFSYNSDIEAFESTRIFRVNIPKNTAGITAKYMAMIVSHDTEVLGFRTRNSSNATIDEGSLILKDDKKLYYVNIEDADVDHVDMYLANSYSRLYDFYIGDELPNFNIENFTITEPIVEKEPLWLSELNRDTVSAKGFKGQNLVIPVNRLTSKNFKRYVFFQVEKSRPDLVMPIIFRIVNEFAQTIVSVTNEGRYGVVELTSQQQLDARGFLIIVSNNYEGGTDQDWVRIKNVRTSDSLSIQLVAELEIPKVQTSFEGKDLNYDEFYVGKTLFQGKAPDSVSRQIDINNENGYSNVSMYDYTNKSFSHKGVESVTVVDTKGTGVGRSLQTIDPSGMMFFSDANVSKKIQFEDFLNSLEPHDGKANNGTTDLNKDGITFINLPENASDSVKEADYQRMKSQWKMLPQNVTLENYGDAIVINPYQASRFSNGSLMSDKQLIRLGGETVIPNLNNPILGNPTHLLIYTTGDALLQEIPLGDHTTLNKGFLNVDQGSILYNEPVEAIIDWTNGKSIDVPVTLSAGTYKIAVRGRRYSTALVDGTIQVANDNGSSGSINMGAARSSEGQVIDESATITLTATTQITLTANCATTKPLELHNGGAETLAWGFTARGSFGTIVEYKTFPTRREGMAYFTRDNGESWQMLFDCSLNTIFTSTDNYHLHGACYDPYWKKLYIVAGDSEPDILPVLHCNFDQSTNLSTVEWKHSPQGISLYKANIGEQYCSVYAHKDYIFFGSDFTMTGLYRMPRINKENLSHREPCFVINDTRITHVPTVFYQKNADEELFCLTIGATDQDMDFAPREYRTSLLHSTMDGVTWNEVWKDEIKIQGFGLNNYTKVFHYKDYVIMHVFKDFRFENNHSIIILKYV